MHSICLAKYLDRQNECPCCHSEWVETERSIFERNNIVFNDFDGNDLEHMDVIEETPENIFEDDSNVHNNSQQTPLSTNSTNSSAGKYF